MGHGGAGANETFPRIIFTPGEPGNRMKEIVLCGSADLPIIFEIINESALVYKGVIPADRWHEPYMPMSELLSEIGKGIRFYGYGIGDRLAGVMGIQDVKDVTLIRHAYVRTECRGQGIGRKLLAHLNRLTDRPVLIGTWKAATWAIRFYEKSGFALMGDDEKNRLLKIYWNVPDRQIEESVVWRISAGLIVRTITYFKSDWEAKGGFIDETSAFSDLGCGNPFLFSALCPIRYPEPPYRHAGRFHNRLGELDVLVEPGGGLEPGRVRRPDR
jgi:GNAT superfamily N-acetyltransferase